MIQIANRDQSIMITSARWHHVLLISASDPFSQQGKALITLEPQTRAMRALRRTLRSNRRRLSNDIITPTQ